MVKAYSVYVRVLIIEKKNKNKYRDTKLTPNESVVQGWSTLKKKKKNPPKLKATKTAWRLRLVIKSLKISHQFFFINLKINTTFHNARFSLAHISAFWCHDCYDWHCLFRVRSSAPASFRLINWIFRMHEYFMSESPVQSGPS